MIKATENDNSSIISLNQALALIAVAIAIISIVFGILSDQSGQKQIFLELNVSVIQGLAYKTNYPVCLLKNLKHLQSFDYLLFARELLIRVRQLG
jgi:hypothetical protein